MLESTRLSEDRKKELEALLSEAELREKKARRRAVLYTLVPVAVGALFLSVSLYQVSRLQRTATNLNQEIAAKSAELSKKKEELRTTQAQLEHTRADYEAKRAAVEAISQDPKDAQQIARQALLPWAVAVAADKDLSSAQGLAAKAQQLGYGKILICQKQGWWRVLAVFATYSEAQSSVDKIRTSFPEGDSAVRDMAKWCLNRSEIEPGTCKCGG